MTVYRRWIPTRMNRCGDPAQKSPGIDFPICCDDSEQLHVARQLDRDPRIEARSGDAVILTP